MSYSIKISLDVINCWRRESGDVVKICNMSRDLPGYLLKISRLRSSCRCKYRVIHEETQVNPQLRVQSIDLVEQALKWFKRDTYNIHRNGHVIYVFLLIGNKYYFIFYYLIVHKLPPGTDGYQL
jgi:hypothetical protein